jgi:hypothetical protein
MSVEIFFSYCFFDNSSHVCLNDFITENLSKLPLVQIKRLSTEKVKKLNVCLLYRGQNNIWLLAVGAMRYQQFPIPESSGKCHCRTLSVCYSINPFLKN